jgi:hypothetical protein
VKPQLKNIAKFLPAFLILSTSLITVVKPAQANPFGFLNDINRSINGVNDGVNGIRGTQANATGTLGNLSNLLGLSKPETPVDPNTQILDIYARWYVSMAPAEKEILNWLTTQYAEDKPIVFTTFSKSPLYKSMNAQTKTKASAIFFKYSEVIKAVGPQKDKFLAFSFCVNGGSTNCK